MRLLTICLAVFFLALATEVSAEAGWFRGRARWRGDGPMRRVLRRIVPAPLGACAGGVCSVERQAFTPPPEPASIAPVIHPSELPPGLVPPAP